MPRAIRRPARRPLWSVMSAVLRDDVDRAGGAAGPAGNRLARHCRRAADDGPENGQALESQLRVDRVDAGQVAHPRRAGQAAGQNDLDGLLLDLLGVSQFGPNALQETQRQGPIADDDARLHGRHRVRADRLRGLDQLDAGQASRPRRQRLEADLDARGDRAADVAAVAGDAVERRGGPEIHDDRRRAVQPSDGQAVHQAVRPDFGRPLGSDGDRHDRGSRREQLQAASLGDRLDGAGQGRHHGRQRDAGHVGEGGAVQAQQAVDEDFELVRRRRGARRGPPAGHDGLAGNEAEGHVGVADIEREQHSPMIPPRRRAQPARVAQPPRVSEAPAVPDRLVRPWPLRYDPPVRHRRLNSSPPLPQEEWCRPCRQRSSS